jgi:5-(carboxyamino)imidazole ribonucleotide synthase
MTDREVIGPGGRVGILGGGQLGRMMAVAAAELGLSTVILCPDPASPAFAVAADKVVADYADETALAAFAEQVDVITYEFENIPAATVEFLAERRPVFPPAKPLSITQDRLIEKRMLTTHGIAVAPFAPVDSAEQLGDALARIGRPAILKARRFGYDGKGQAVIRGSIDPATAWQELGGVPAILEGYVAFHTEVSVIVARDRDGEVAAYAVTENRHENGVLAESTVPAAIPADLAEEATAVAADIAAVIGHVGVMAVEMFVVGEGGRALLVNEIAPRVHNSGHWTMDACVCSQFEQHIRAICGWPLGSTARHADATMVNLLGTAVEDWQRYAADPAARVHIYGKAEARPGRKMGHVTRLTPLQAAARPAGSADEYGQAELASDTAQAESEAEQAH